MYVCESVRACVRLSVRPHLCQCPFMPPSVQLFRVDCMCVHEQREAVGQRVFQSNFGSSNGEDDRSDDFSGGRQHVCGSDWCPKRQNDTHAYIHILG